MKTQGTIDLFMYWNRIRGDLLTPPRSKVEPSDIRGVLPYTFILQNSEANKISFRLAGTRLCALLGGELRHKPFDLVFQERDHQLIAKLVESCRRDKLVVSLSLEGVTLRRRTFAFDMVLLPLAQEDGHGLILGCIQSESFGQWLGRDHIERFNVESLRMVDPNREKELLSQRLALDVPTLIPNTGDAMQPLPYSDDAKIIPIRSGMKFTIIEGGKKD